MAVDAGASGAGDYGDVQLPKRRAYDNVSGKVSGRPWKATFGRASSIAGRPPSDWEAKMADKAKKKAIQARSCCALRTRHGGARGPTLRRLTAAPGPAAADAASGAQEHVAGVKKDARDKAVAEKQRRAEVKTRREENRKASQVVQKITNPKKLSKLSKKQVRAPEIAIAGPFACADDIHSASAGKEPGASLNCCCARRKRTQRTATMTRVTKQRCLA
jgi:hypothetical protein